MATTSRTRICELDEVQPGEVIPATVKDMPPLAVYRLEDGSVHVTDAICSHGNANLAEGYLEGDEIECPFHAGRFCVRTGEPKAFPVSEPIKSYRVSIVEGAVWIEGGEE